MKALRWFSSLWHRRSIEDEMCEEIRLHLEQRIRENMASGMLADEASNAALRQFGGVEQVKEIARGQRSGAWLEQAARDVRYAIRSLAKAPAFATVAIVSLALGIGANTSVFSVVNAILLASLPVPNPQELRVVQWSGVNPKLGNITGSYRRGGAGGRGEQAPMPGPNSEGSRDLCDAFSYPVYRTLRDQCAGVIDLFGQTDLHDMTVQARGEPFVTEGLIVTDNFFSGLGVRPVAGRLFVAGEESLGTPPLVVISDELWARGFARDANAIGRSLLLNGTAFTIIGVVPPAFRGLGVADETAFYLPMSAQPLFRRGYPTTSQTAWWVHLMGRVRPGVTNAQLQTVLDTSFAPAVGSIMKAPRIEIFNGRAGTGADQNFYRRPLLLLLGIVGIVILVACANLAGLSLARAAAREHEMAVRAALGSGRWRLMRQSLAESFVVAGAGGVLGLLLALWGKSAIGALMLGSGEQTLRYDVALDFNVLGFTLGITVLTAILAGLLPAWRAGRVNPLSGLKSRGALSAPKLRIGKVLVAAQVALAVLLVAAGGLYVRTLLNLVRINPGFSVENVLLFRLNPRAAGMTGAAGPEFLGRAQTVLERLPGVKAVTICQYKLLSGVMSGGGFFRLPARPELTGEKAPNAYRLNVGDNFFVTFAIPVILGRSFTAAETEASGKVVVVNQAFVRAYFPDEMPVGQVLMLDKTEWRIVGVCADVKYSDLRMDPPATVYFPYRQAGMSSGYMVVRTSVPPLTIVPEARRAINELSSAVPLADITTQKLVRDGRLNEQRVFAFLVGSLAGLAVLLACIGLYGLMAYSVARRSGEIGIRMALGAEPRTVARRILGETLVLASLGTAIGVVVALSIARLISSQLYGVPPHDPWTFVGGAALMLAIAAVAAWVPARRASRVDPLVALRAE